MRICSVYLCDGKQSVVSCHRAEVGFRASVWYVLMRQFLDTLKESTSKLPPRCLLTRTWCGIIMVQSSHFSVKEVLASERLANSTESLILPRSSFLCTHTTLPPVSSSTLAFASNKSCSRKLSIRSAPPRCSLPRYVREYVLAPLGRHEERLFGLDEPPFQYGRTYLGTPA
jgi:hypothetical protein